MFRTYVAKGQLHRHYKGSEGYFGVVGGRSLLEKFDKTLGCAEHETMMYLESYSPEAGV
jgi:hypothetical protein